MSALGRGGHPAVVRRGAAARGFTVIELIVVLGILGALVLVGVPNVRDRASEQRLAAAARLLASDLRLARDRALALRAPVTVAFSTSDAACPAGADAYVVLRGATRVKRVCLPPDVRLEAAPSPRVTFDGLGHAADGITIRLRSARTGRTVQLAVSAGTGAVTDGAP